MNWKNAELGDLKRAAVIADVLGPDPRLIDFMFHPDRPQLRDEPEVLLKEMGCYSSGEKILLKFCMDLWGGYGNVRTTDLYERLDDRNFEKVIQAMKDIRKI